MGISVIRCVSSTGGRGMQERERKEGCGGEGGEKELVELLGMLYI